METVFTPWASLGGGALIGLASALLMAFHGRVFGATGILAGFLMPTHSGGWAWRAALLAGMVTAPLLIFAVSGAMPTIQVPVSYPMLVIGGVIVGVGVTFSSGCTSGHGVCGNARLSPRSMVATITFMITTAITVYLVRHVIGA